MTGKTFEMEILGECVLYKTLKFSGTFLTLKTWNTIYEATDDEYFKQSDIDFPKEFLLKFRTYFNVSHFIPADVKKAIQQIGIEYGLFSHIVKIKGTITGESDTTPEKKKKTKISIFKF